MVPERLPLREEDGPTPYEAYGLSKQVGENIASMFGRAGRGAIDFISLRFTNIVKRELWSQLPWAPPESEKPRTLVMWAYTHEDDVLDAHVLALEAPKQALGP